MKKLLAVTLVLFAFSVFGQVENAYIYGKKPWYCASSDTIAMKYFNTGLRSLVLNRTLNRGELLFAAANFDTAFRKDSTFCDAVYFNGYTLELLRANKAKVMNRYLIADSLAQHRSLEFMSSVAQMGFYLGTEKSIAYSRKTYIEMINHFPDHPEGYFGYAMVGPFFEEDQRALININISIKKQIERTGRVNADAMLLKGVLLILNEKYEESLECFKKCEPTFGKTEVYKIHYALGLLKSAGSDPKKLRQAKKAYNDIANKDWIPIYLQRFFIPLEKSKL